MIGDPKLLEKLGTIVRKAIQAEIPIRRWGRLRKGIRANVDGNSVTVSSIYFWTRFVNDGRRAVTAKPGKGPLVFFKDPELDPRIRRGYPRTAQTIRRLTRRSFRYHKKLGRLIITREVGPTTGLKFLEKGLQTARRQVPDEVRKRILSDVRRNLSRSTDSIIIRL